MPDTNLKIFRDATNDNKHLKYTNLELRKLILEFPEQYVLNKGLRFDDFELVYKDKGNMSNIVLGKKKIESRYFALYTDQRNKGDVIEALTVGIHALALERAKRAGKDKMDPAQIINNTWERLKNVFEDGPQFIQEYGSGDHATDIANTLYYCVKSLIVTNQEDIQQGIDYLHEIFYEEYAYFDKQCMNVNYFNNYRFAALKKAADHENCIASLELGDMYYYGVTLDYNANGLNLQIPKDRKKAYEYYAKGARKGFPFSLWAQGDMLLSKTATPEQLADAAKAEGWPHKIKRQDEAIRAHAERLFRQAVQVYEYCAIAHNSLGVIHKQRANAYHFGTQLDPSIKDNETRQKRAEEEYAEAIRCFDKAKGYGLEFSRNQLMVLVEMDKERVFKALKLKGKEKREKYIQELYEGTDPYNGNGQNKLGHYWLIRDDKEKAMQAFVCAAKAGISVAYWNIFEHILFYNQVPDAWSMDVWEAKIKEIGSSSKKMDFFPQMLKALETMDEQRTQGQDKEARKTYLTMMKTIIGSGTQTKANKRKRSNHRGER